MIRFDDAVLLIRVRLGFGFLRREKGTDTVDQPQDSGPAGEPAKPALTLTFDTSPVRGKEHRGKLPPGFVDFCEASTRRQVPSVGERVESWDALPFPKSLGIELPL